VEATPQCYTFLDLDDVWTCKEAFVYGLSGLLSTPTSMFTVLVQMLLTPS